MTTFKTPKGTELPFLNLKGKQYLQVMHRLVWFREQHPDWSIKTIPYQLTEAYCVFAAEISNHEGKLIQTGHGREDSKHFPDFIEKAETKAMGRALAACGFGTQFAPELDEGERIADSPAPRMSTLASIASTAYSAPAEYKIKFGQYAGKTFKEVGASSVQRYIDYLHSGAAKEGKPLSGLALELIENFDAFKNKKQVKQKPEEEPPPLGDEQLPF